MNEVSCEIVSQYIQVLQSLYDSKHFKILRRFKLFISSHTVYNIRKILIKMMPRFFSVYLIYLESIKT